MITDLFAADNQAGCFNYDKACQPPFAGPCTEDHPANRYNDASAAWVLTSAIIVFFMKAGFLLIELAFAQHIRDKRHVVVVKHLDVFASAFGFFFLGFDVVSNYTNPHGENPLRISDPILWFFKFTFASNAATILGGCLVTNKYKLRVPAAFLSAFVISGIIHPLIARFIWGDSKDTAYFSVYRFYNESQGTCDKTEPFRNRMYILDFAGGGAVHLVGGVAGLVLCLFAKLQNYLDEKKLRKRREQLREQGNESADDQKDLILREEAESIANHNFWEWMYPVDGGGESTSEAALGVLILWFCWFAFNCGSTESIESSAESPQYGSFHDVPSVIAVNMILAAAAGGTLSVLIASWAQIRSQSDSMNANEIANGILSALVAITAGCAFVDYWAACVIGVIAVIVYHVGCWLEYKLGIEDTARVVPVHGLCGFWSLLATGLFLFGDEAMCNLHSTIEGLCYHLIRLPNLSYGERIATQLIAIALMTGITASISFVLYGFLYIIPIRSKLQSNTRMAHHFNKFMSKVFKIVFNRDHETIYFEGNLLFTGPEEVPHIDVDNARIRQLVRRANQQNSRSQLHNNNASTPLVGSHNNAGYSATNNETLGTNRSRQQQQHDSAGVRNNSSTLASKTTETSFDEFELETDHRKIQ